DFSPIRLSPAQRKARVITNDCADGSYFAWSALEARATTAARVCPGLPTSGLRPSRAIRKTSCLHTPTPIATHSRNRPHPRPPPSQRGYPPHGSRLGQDAVAIAVLAVADEVIE